MRTIFLKLGGSLITDKDKPYTPRLKIIHSIGQQIQQALKSSAPMHLLIGHGSGSFGHAAAKNAGYINGKPITFKPQDFQSVWFAAHHLNRIIVDEFNQLSLPVMSFPPSAAIESNGKNIVRWDIAPIISALNQGFIPIIFGDAVLDSKLGGVIYSTEELFLYLAEKINPELILLAGKEKGVWADFPHNKQLLSELSEKKFSKLGASINSSNSTDVTGGMRKKVELMFHVRKLRPDTKIYIFSGEAPQAIFLSLTSIPFGTSIK